MDPCFEQLRMKSYITDKFIDTQQENHPRCEWYWYCMSDHKMALNLKINNSNYATYT